MRAAEAKATAGVARVEVEPGAVVLAAEAQAVVVLVAAEPVAAAVGAAAMVTVATGAVAQAESSWVPSWPDQRRRSFGHSRFLQRPRA